MERDIRRWCPVWSQKFPSFSHDPVKNFTFCRLCRNSRIPLSQGCVWAVGQGPPMSGWRVRRLMRHLGSQEHIAARQAALDTCKRALEYEKKNGSDEESACPSELFGDPSMILGNCDDGLEHPGTLTFKDVSKLLNVEMVMMKAYSSSYIRPRSNRKRAHKSICTMSDRPTMVPPPSVNSGNVRCLEILYDDANEEFAENNTCESDREGTDAVTETTDRLSPVIATVDEPITYLYPKRRSNGTKTESGRRAEEDGFEVPIDSLLCLPESLKILAESQTRIANAIESMVGLQREMLRTMRDVSDSLRNNSNS
uniref:Uncharacterized protein LOC100179512 n=1 Tax=Phallusia mammillata TaxID=59560 RepID=A0A6F9DHK0_9ASCI|nr:uncharacterized protein LOC100179512 [Phallusia mammillata]